MQYIGCHLSSSKGFAAMGKTALSIGANTFQFFTRNPRGGAAKDIDPQDAQALVLMQGSGEIGKIVAHAPYTLNPCAKEEKTLEFARNTMQDDLRRMEFVPGNFYNFHPGSHVGQGTEEGIRKIAETLDLAMFEGQTTIVLLETMAGKGTEVGGRFEELRAIIDRTAENEALESRFYTYKKEQIDADKRTDENERKKAELISDLASSPDFATTHFVIKKMRKITAWTQTEIEKLFIAARNNSQVLYILGDTDIKAFYQRLLNNCEVLSEDAQKVKERIEESDNS